MNAIHIECMGSLAGNAYGFICAADADEIDGVLYTYTFEDGQIKCSIWIGSEVVA